MIGMFIDNKGEKIGKWRNIFSYVLQPLEDEEKKDQEEKKDEEKPLQQPFQQLYVSCPDGLNVKFMLESSLGMSVICNICHGSSVGLSSSNGVFCS